MIGPLAVSMMLVATRPKAERPNHSSDPLAETVALLRRDLDRQLKDYPSARFRDVHVKALGDGSGYEACGFINSKNSYGAYTGWQRFAVVGGKNPEASVVFMSDDSVQGVAVDSTCTPSFLDAPFAPEDVSARIAPKP